MFTVKTKYKTFEARHLTAKVTLPPPLELQLPEKQH